MNSFEGKVAAITGAGSGMGRALALALADRRCHLALSDVHEANLAETARLVAEAGVRVTTRRVDVAERDQIYAWADEVVREHGRCNLIFNNAGVALGASAAGVSTPSFEWIVDINFWGVVHGTQAFLPHLIASGEGHVINTSSLFGLIAFPGSSAYNATKFAVRGYTEALRIELDLGSSNVCATSVHPGGIKTAIARSARMDPSMCALGFGEMSENQVRFERLFRTSPEAAAETILRGVRRKARRVLIGGDAHLVELIQRVFPSGYQRLLVWLTRLSVRG